MKKIVILLLSILWLSACDKDINMDNPADNPADRYTPTLDFSENDVIKGRMRIKLKEEPTGNVSVRSSGGQVTTGVRSLDALAMTLGITRMERTFPYSGKYEKRARKEGMHLWYDVWYSETVTTTRAVSNMGILDGIEMVCPVHKIKINTAPMPSQLVESLAQTIVRGTNLPWNDTKLAQQWNLRNAGTESWQTEGADIRLADVCQQYNGNSNIVVAIVDGGISPSNPDLQANIWTNPNETPGNEMDDDNNGYKDDIHGYNFVNNNATITAHRHGTHVAGIIGATSNNGVGISGIAGGNGTPNSGVKLMSCQIFTHSSGTDDLNYDNMANNTPAAIQYAADNGAIICQNSWGYEGSINEVDKTAIDYFIKYAGCDNDGNQLPNSPMKGGIVIFATNNHNSSDPRDATPADYEKVIGVAAIGPNFEKASYSDYGEYIDLCAPGGELKSVPNEANIYSTSTPARNDYEYMAGASMACPHISGVAALVIEKYGVAKRGFTPSQLIEILLKSAYDIDSYNPSYIGKLGSGCVNAAGALQADLPSPKPFLLKSNPVKNGSLLFRANIDLAGSAVVTIYNSIGNVVLRKNIKTQRYITTSLDINRLAAGYYTLQYDCNGESVKEKFVKY